MDSQRYDLNKRRKLSTLSIATAATHGHIDQPIECQGYADSPTEIMEESWADLTVAVLAGSRTFSISDEDETSTTAGEGSQSSTEESTSSSSTLVVAATILNHKNETQSTDVFEKDGYTTTRTIIRPHSPRSPLLALFSRPSSPGMMISRPSSPLGRRLGSLNCMGSTDAFEEELDFIQQKRERELAGVDDGLRVRIAKERSVLNEERWRDAIQAILYERLPPRDSCVGHVEVY
ncbi:hypothetical protein B0H34DRAFT_673390 [Crassisporium funariophilum]|nr:hypothetical protein B0H34DRAFT_673390 [Crassisporium funariophilum]